MQYKNRRYPVSIKVEVIGNLFRLVDSSTGNIARHSGTGTVLDGGGHTNNQAAKRQAGYINASFEKKQTKSEKKQ